MNDKSALKQLIESDEFSNRLNLDRKTYGLVFDRRTLNAMYEVIKKYNVDYIDFPISSGKESLIFNVKLRDKSTKAMKIYKMSTLKFSNTMEYIKGDYRFDKEKITRSNVVYVWTQKEYTNLQSLKNAAIHAPKPYGFYKNILLMSYLGTSRSPAPQIKDLNDNFNEIYIKLRSYIWKMYNKAGLVHADLSEYNILYYRKEPYIIDVGQSVSTKHPMADEFLKRDVTNITTFFHKKGVECDASKLYDYVKGDIND
ncbi:serine protein kinase RIO [Ferroplasma sp.]|uniref:serine protein kinase RIO n=1 Tax=Ferroplasma sp. TaxID=2591003 RepID=UPI00307F58F4